MLDMTLQAAQYNSLSWDAFRQQLDEGLIQDPKGPTTDLLDNHVEFGGTRHGDLCVKNIKGKRVLDMGCGDGTQILKWARLGAIVVGVDNSPGQLLTAQRGAQKMGLSPRFIQADLLRLPADLLNGQFDMVFSSWVTSWIGDLDKWFRNVWKALKPGGIFLLNARHPVSHFVTEMEAGFSYRDSYFSQGPFTQEAGWNDNGDLLTTVEWGHSLGSIVTAIAQAGLRISDLLELPNSQLNSKGRPAAFTLRAIKDRRHLCEGGRKVRHRQQKSRMLSKIIDKIQRFYRANPLDY